MENGTPPVVHRIRSGLSDEEAYKLEESLIQEYGRRFSEENGQLFNISDNRGGSPSGIQKPWGEDRRKVHQDRCKTQRKYDPTYEELYDDYITLNKMRKEIAKEYGVSEVLVKKRLQELGIKKPKSMCYPKRNECVCLYCHKSFSVASSVTRTYCSRACYLASRYGSDDGSE